MISVKRKHKKLNESHVKVTKLQLDRYIPQLLFYYQNITKKKTGIY